MVRLSYELYCIIPIYFLATNMDYHAMGYFLRPWSQFNKNIFKFIMLNKKQRDKTSTAK